MGPIGLLCWLFGHKDRPHYAATPRRRLLGVQCDRCLRVDRTEEK
jgi:hypothetical protein